MRTTEGQHGVALTRLLEAEWAARGQSRTAWAIANGMQPPTVQRWGEGSDPKLSSLRAIAEALDRPMLDVLVAAEVLTPEEAGGREVAPPRIPDIDDAIDLDPEFSAAEREQIRGMVELIRNARKTGRGGRTRR